MVAGIRPVGPRAGLCSDQFCPHSVHQEPVTHRRVLDQSTARTLDGDLPLVPRQSACGAYGAGHVAGTCAHPLSTPWAADRASQQRTLMHFLLLATAVVHALASAAWF